MAPPTPTPAPVSLENVNTLSANGVFLHHLWQEYHWKAPTTKYLGHTDEDKKVVERLDAEKALVAKKTLNTAFCEWAIATVDVDVPAGATLYMRWWLEDGAGTLVAEHPDFSAANFKDKKPAAKIKTAKYGWRWDGRRPNDNKLQVFMREPCVSRLEVKSSTDKSVPLKALASAEIRPEGDPYKIWIIGQPKADGEMEDEMNGRGGKRWLDSSGSRLQGDCWIKVFRGVANPGGPEHLVFLGHGAVEATDVELPGESPNSENPSNTPRWGAIATPHDTAHKGYVRQGTHGQQEFWLCEMVDPDDKADSADAWFITLPKVGSLPPANNPFCDKNSGRQNKPFKNGVHTHHSFASSPGHILKAASVGCTTVMDLFSGTHDKPSVLVGTLRANRVKFGTWNGEKPPKDKKGKKPWGPPVEDGRPGGFYNKQTMRGSGHDSDALIEDDFNSPVIAPPPAASPATVWDQTLHVQPTGQHAIFGGFVEHEIPHWVAAGPADPDGPGLDVDPMLRIRCMLKQAPENTKYWQYHRLIGFGHSVSNVTLNGFKVKAYFPRMAERLWNGHWRNLQVKGQAQYAWFIEKRDGATNETVAWVSKKPAGTADYVDLPDSEIGLAEHAVSVKPTSPAEYFSVIKYRIKLHPDQDPATSVWETISGRDDLLTEQQVSVTKGPLARIAGETIVQDGSVHYLVGKTEVRILPPTVDTPVPGGGRPGGGALPA